MRPRAFNKGLTREQFTPFSAVEKSWWIIHHDTLDGIVEATAERITWQQTDDQPDADATAPRLFANWNATERIEEYRQRRMRDHFERERLVAAAREHQLPDLVDPDDADRVRRLFAFGNTRRLPADEWEAEHKRRILNARAEFNRLRAAAEEHRARATRYEKQLRMPLFSAATHVRGTRWEPQHMCAAQWRQLLQIRAHDRERRARKREHDRAVERELQTMTNPATPREPVAA
jgi:hypothetical protein